MEKFRIKISLIQLILLALLLAIGIVIANLSVGTAIWKVTFLFIPNTLMGMIAGPIWTALALGIGDIIGTLIGGGAYFPGFTLTAIVVGLIYGLFFYRKRLNIKHWQDWLYVAIAMLVVAIVQTLILNNIWIFMLLPGKHTTSVFWKLVSTRSLLLIQIPIKTIILMLIMPVLQKIPQISKFLNLK